MKLLSVGCAALNQTPLDWDGNRDRIVAAIARAREQQVQVLCLPELAVSGYGCEDLFLSPGVQRTALEVLQEIIPHTVGIAVGVGLPLYVGNDCYNAAAFIADGVLQGFVLKQFLARDGLYYEPRWFRAWRAGEHTHVRIGTAEFPVGDLLFQVANKSGEQISVGFEICEDAWSASRPGSRLAAQGANLILNPSASHFAFDRFEIRKRFVIEGSRAYGVTYLYANLLGNEAGRVVYDGSCFIAASGELVAQGQRFGFDDIELTSTTVDLDLGIVTRQRSADAAVLEGSPSPHTTAIPEVIAVSSPWKSSSAKSPPPAVAAWEDSSEIRFEEFSRAQALGLFDYMRKSASHGFVVSLSGGADSAAVSCLIRIMAELSVHALGLDRMKERIGMVRSGWVGLQTCSSLDKLMGVLLTTVYQSTENSSSITRAAAKAVADAIGSSHVEWDVQEVVTSYLSLAEAALGAPLTWEADDIARQNIQARARAPGVWILANVRKALLLSTSNRSEVAVGYATMDGDTAGGLAPIAGIDKAFIRKWLSWLQHTGPTKLSAIPALKAIVDQPPTAELRPLGANQTDEADLMPYEILNRIEQCLVELGYSPQETLNDLVSAYAGKHSASELGTWVDRFLVLFTRNQWKRERYAPSFHMDGHNLDPRSYYRFPILSGGFGRERRALS